MSTPNEKERELIQRLTDSQETLDIAIGNQDNVAEEFILTQTHYKIGDILNKPDTPYKGALFKVKDIQFKHNYYPGIPRKLREATLVLHGILCYKNGEELLTYVKTDILKYKYIHHTNPFQYKILINQGGSKWTSPIKKD